MLKLAIVNQYSGFENSIIIDLIREAAAKPVELTGPVKCDILIIGPHWHQAAPLFKRAATKFDSIFQRIGLSKREYKPVTFFQTWENVRYNYIAADFSMSFDLGIESEQHLRFPIWMTTIDWTHEGLPARHNTRLGKMITIERLMSPLGRTFLQRPKKAAIFCSHMGEPRKALFDALSRMMPVDGYGPAFDKSIANHNESGFTKSDILSKYSFNLCPENSLYPGYYTEKIPEAFSSDTLPITWADINIGCDFNPDAFINLLPCAKFGYEAALSELLESGNLQRCADSPLLTERPSIEPARLFIHKIVKAAN